jgi:DNA-binding NarL/FixJ family response regulator
VNTRPPRSFARKKLLLLEADPWRRASLSEFLASEGFDVRVVFVEADDVDVVLVNLCEPDGEPRKRLEAVRAVRPGLKIAAFVREVAADTVFPCLLLGVKGILPFDADNEELRSALGCVIEGSLWTPRAVLSQWIDRIAAMGLGESGSHGLTRSEQRVLAGVREDLTNKEIARRLGVTEATIKFHVGKLLRKTGARGRRELARFARESVPGLVSPVPA